MLDIKRLISDKDNCINQLNKRGNDYTQIINQAIELYNQYLSLKQTNEENKQVVNSNSKLI